MNSHKEALKHFRDVDPKIYDYAKSVDYDAWFTKRPRDGEHAYFHSLCRSIIGQQLSTKAASTIYGRFVELVKEVTPDSILEVNDQQLRDVGLSWAKASYVGDLAVKVTKGMVHLNKLESMSDDEIVKELTMIKGIGSWTVEMFLMFTLNREDVFSYGDLGLKKGIEKIYEIESPTRIQIEEIVAVWTPYKTYGSIALWHSLES